MIALQDTGRIEVATTEVRTVSPNRDAHIRYAVFIGDAMPAVYGIETRHLASSDSTGGEHIIKNMREWHHRLPGNTMKWSNKSTAMYASDGTGGGRGRDGGRGIGGSG